MSIAQGYESNSGMADYYTASLHEIEKHGALVREEKEISALTSVDIQRVARNIFAGTPPIVFYNKPTLTYTQLGVSLGFITLLLWFFAYRYIRQIRAR